MKRKKGWHERRKKYIAAFFSEKSNFTMFVCGTCEHAWDGQKYEDETTSTATCSKCGMHQIDYDMMVGP